MIIKLLGVNVNTYCENFLEIVKKIERVCPLCRGDCTRHGYYERYAIADGESLQIKILRIKCKKCKRTHAIIPAFLRPYSPYTQDTREKALRIIYEGAPKAETARELGISRELLRWWEKAFEQRAPQVILAIQSMFHRVVIEASVTCWERLQNVIKKLGTIVENILMQANVLANGSGMRIWV